MRCDIGVEVRLQGWHSWPDAHDQRAYLASLHRHMFHVRADVQVFHDDREVEFHDLRDVIATWWGDEASQTDRGSCEHIARDLHDFLAAYVGTDRYITVSVGEDGEAWATVRRAST